MAVAGPTLPAVRVIARSALRAEALRAQLAQRGFPSDHEATLTVLLLDDDGGLVPADVTSLVPNGPVVVVGRPSRKVLWSLLDDGVHAVVDAEPATALDAAITAAAAGYLTLPYDAYAERRSPVLSRREKQILGLVVMGLSNGEIARKLVLSETTVKSHLRNCFVKLGVKSRNEATALILDPEGRLGTGILAITDGSGR
jgi:DNA-binding NarL/FixJ family response regulator